MLATMTTSSIRQFFQFSLVGLVSFTIDVVVMWLLADKLPLVLARVLAFAAAVLSNWIFHRIYTFKDHATLDAKLREATHFTIASLLGMLPNVGIYWWTVSTGFYQTHQDFPFAPVLAMIPGIMVGHCVNFALAKYWVFNPSKHRTSV